MYCNLKIYECLLSTASTKIIAGNHSFRDLQIFTNSSYLEEGFRCLVSVAHLFFPGVDQKLVQEQKTDALEQTHHPKCAFGSLAAPALLQPINKTQYPVSFIISNVLFYKLIPAIEYLGIRLPLHFKCSFFKSKRFKEKREK